MRSINQRKLFKSRGSIDNVVLTNGDMSGLCKPIDELTDDIMDDVAECCEEIFAQCINKRDGNIHFMEFLEALGKK